MFPKHPTYTHSYDDWVKYRDILEGGDAFVQKYLRQLTMTESNPDYFLRRALSYNPAFAKSALVDIKNSIVQRMPDIHRTRGPTTYESAVLGQNRGVSGLGDSMNSFLSKEIILELLGMGKVGVFVDREALPETPSLSDVAGKHPYMYPYRAEQILNWTYSADNILDKLLLSHCEYTYDPEYGLVTGLKEVYRLFEKSSIGVKITDFEVNTKETTVLDSRILDLDEIPFVIFELEYSLLNDIADYQIALLNLCSTDLLAAIKSGSMYVEQYDPDNETEYLRPAPETVNNPQQTGTGTEFQGREPDKARNKEMITGGVRGRRYSRGLNAPEFISPSMDPFSACL